MQSKMAHEQKQGMSKLRIIKNLIVICIGFLLLFCAYQALANLQSTINSEGGLGVISQSVIYAALIISSLLIPKLLINKLGCKWTIVLSILTYSPYIAANFHPTLATILPTSILIGIGAAPLWAAKCTYLNEIGFDYALLNKETAEVTISKFFGVFFMFFQNTQIWGNLISYYVLKPANGSIHKNISSVVCGADFCHEDSNATNPNLKPPEDQQRFVLIGIYLACSLTAAAIVAIFLDPLKKKKETDNSSIFSRVGATIKHWRHMNQLLMIPLTIFSGIEQAYILSDFTRAYIACAWGIYHVGFVFICFGVVDGIMSFVAGRLLKYIPRLPIMIAGSVGNAVACIIMFLWTPNPDQSYVFFLIIGIWGFSDAIWQTQVNALYGVLFQTEVEAGFSSYRLWESVGFSIAFAYSSSICTALKIYILLTFLVVGMIGYILVELRTQCGKSIKHV